MELQASAYANTLGMQAAVLFIKVNYSYLLDCWKEK